MTFSTERRVEFRDTDAAGIVHFSVFFPMMEVAEHEMLRSLGISVLPKPESGLPPLSWPRVAASCNYLSPARFEDILTISVQVAKIGSTSVQYRFRFSCADQLVAEGSMTVVCCRVTTAACLPGQASGEQALSGRASGGLEKTPIPGAIRELLAKHE